MKVQLGDREIHIRFASEGRMTTCVIAEDKYLCKVLDTGVTMRSHKDWNNPDRAREISLSRAIKELPRTQRFKVWERYITVYKPHALKSFYRDAEIAKNRADARRHPSAGTISVEHETPVPISGYSGHREAQG